MNKLSFFMCHAQQKKNAPLQRRNSETKRFKEGINKSMIRTKSHAVPALFAFYQKILLDRASFNFKIN